MIRRVTAGLIVVALAVGVWVLWPREEPDTTPTTTAGSVATTVGSTTTSTTTPTTTRASTTVGTSHVVTTVEEAEEILRELLYFRFVAIAHSDEEALTTISATEEAAQAAIEAITTLEFTSEPAPSGIGLEGVEILESSETCLALWAEIDTSAFMEGVTSSSGVVILRFDDGLWKWMSLWRYREDLWAADCGSPL